MPIRYLSVCSGIEAASVAWEPLGWRPVAFSEIDAFPSAVLAHHYPSVPNWGDMTRFKEWPDRDIDLLVGATPTLRAMGHSASHANAGGQLAVAFDAQAGGNTGLAIGEDVAGTLHGGGSHGGRAAVATRWAVRRLTPLECERLQGFPDGYTDVPYRNRNRTPDGPRYKALGNSMAVNAMEWIGQRIEYVRTILAEQGPKS